MNNKVFNNLSYGVYVVSCECGGKYTGCTVNSIMQITSNPAVIALSVNHNNYTNECIRNVKKFAVSVLSEVSNPLSIGTFGFRSGRDCNKFEIIPYELYNNLPVIKDACAYMIAEVSDEYETSTHTVFIAHVIDGDVLNDSKPMTYSFYHNVIKGKTPKLAPTFIND